MPTPTLEERVEALETELRSLRASLKPEQDYGKIPWAGTINDDETFDEVLRLGREWRQREHGDSEGDLP